MENPLPDGRSTVSLASSSGFSIQTQSAVSSVEFAIATWDCATNVPGISVEGLIEECEEMQQVIVSQGELGLFSRPISVTDPPQVLWLVWRPCCTSCPCGATAAHLISYYTAAPQRHLQADLFRRHARSPKTSELFCQYFFHSILTFSKAI